MISKTVARLRRKARVRMNVSGTANKPRLSVFRSNVAFYVQAIDDEAKVTIISASTLKEKSANTDAVVKLAQSFGKDLKAKGIETVVFDRNGYRYHGKVKAFADALREIGIIF